MKRPEPEPFRHRYEARKCEAPGCVEATKDQKAFCIRHIALMPYAAEVQREARKRARSSGRRRRAS